MNRYLLPSILIVTVLMAGIFAFQPINEASTVHTTIATDIDDQNRVWSWTIESAVGNNVVVPVGNFITGTATLSTIDGSTCELRTGLGANNDGPIDGLGLGATQVAPLVNQDGVSIAVETGVSTCTLTIFVETAAD